MRGIYNSCEHVIVPAVSHTATIMTERLIFIFMLLALTSESTANNYSCEHDIPSHLPACHDENGAHKGKIVEKGSDIDVLF